MPRFLHKSNPVRAKEEIKLKLAVNIKHIARANISLLPVL
jgi:hypothetical protein